MTIEEFNQTRFGAGMQVKINKTGEIKDIISVDFETNKFGLSWSDSNLDALKWIDCNEVELITHGCIVHTTDFGGKCFICGKQAFVLDE